jgi:hypothetical protein
MLGIFCRSQVLSYLTIVNLQEARNIWRPDSLAALHPSLGVASGLDALEVVLRADDKAIHFCMSAQCVPSRNHTLALQLHDQNMIMIMTADIYKL